MFVSRLILSHFRNIACLDIGFDTPVTVFSGRNAQGKTNLLEAVYFAALGRSHRTASDIDLIAWDSGEAAAEIRFSRGGLQQSLVYRFAKNFSSAPAGSGAGTPAVAKQFFHNGFAVRPREAIGLLAVVLFSPEDLYLIKGPPEARRRMLDTEISLVSPVYYSQLATYLRILQQRNRLLKQIREGQARLTVLDAWDQQLAVAAAPLLERRAAAVKKLSMLANLCHRRLTAGAESLGLTYFQANLLQSAAPGPAALPFLSDAPAIQARLAKNRAEDIRRGSTGFGPHRDDIIIELNGYNLRSFGSQGQQRTAVLALKLAELEFVKSEIGEYPVLLLDDVLSELDGFRREQLSLFIRDRIQTFVTTTDPADFSGLSGSCRVFRVSGGAVCEGG